MVGQVKIGLLLPLAKGLRIELKHCRGIHIERHLDRRPSNEVGPCRFWALKDHVAGCWAVGNDSNDRACCPVMLRMERIEDGA